MLDEFSIKRAGLSMLPVVMCALAYIYCIALSVTPVSHVKGLNTSLWISQELLRLGQWIPLNLGLRQEFYASMGDTGYLELVVLLLLTFVVYGVGLFLIYQRALYFSAIQWLIWLVVLISGCIYLFTPGILGSDVFSYASYGRLVSVHSANPYFVSPSAFPHDPTYPFLYWRFTISSYGPLWTDVSALLTLVAGAEPFRLLIAFRVFAFAAHLLNTVLVAATLNAMGRSMRTVTLGMLLYAWNPLVLVESSLGAHNDVFVVTFILLGLWLCARAEKRRITQLRAYVLPLVAFTLAALVKYITAPLIAIFIITLFVRTLRYGGEKQTRAAIAACINALVAWCICLSTMLALYTPFWIGHTIPLIVNSFASVPLEQQVRNSLLFTIDSWNSAHLLPPSLQFLTERNLWSIITVVAAIVPVLIGLLALWRAPDTSTVALVSLASLGGLLLFTPWFFDWYIIWLVGLAAVCLPVMYDRIARALVAFALTFSATANFIYCSALMDWVLLGYHPSYINVITWISWMCLAIFGVPLLVLLIFLTNWPLVLLKGCSLTRGSLVQKSLF
jgi:hypothetical protein